MKVLTALVLGRNEEPGWRGFDLPRLEEQFKPAISTLLLGIIWALCHLPVLTDNPET